MPSMPTFEEALADIASRMNMSPIELLQKMMNLSKEESYIEPSEEYIDAACDAACHCQSLDIGNIFNDS